MTEQTNNVITENTFDNRHQSKNFCNFGSKRPCWIMFKNCFFKKRFERVNFHWLGTWWKKCSRFPFLRRRKSLNMQTKLLILFSEKLSLSIIRQRTVNRKRLNDFCCRILNFLTETNEAENKPALMGKYEFEQRYKSKRTNFFDVWIVSDFNEGDNINEKPIGSYT